MSSPKSGAGRPLSRAGRAGEAGKAGRGGRRRPVIVLAAFAALAALIVALIVARSARTVRPNILLVTLDTTRADRLGAYGYRPAATPRLDRLAREGVLFERAIAAAP